MPPVTRRQFLTISTAAAAALLTACRESAAPATVRGPAAPSVPTTAGPTTTTATPVSSAPPPATQRVLVVVQLNGGNDALNTLVPIDGRYHDLRPTLGLKEGDLVTLTGTTAYGLHPALAPLARASSAGRLALLAGIGFDDPIRSHFVSRDRWWRADDLTTTSGWLGRWLDHLPGDPAPLTAVALDDLAPLLDGAVRRPSVVLDRSRFAFPSVLPHDALAALGTTAEGTNGLTLAAAHALALSLGAVADLAGVAATAGSSPTADPTTSKDESSALATSLRLAAELATASVGTRVVVVSAGGFDTHAGQAARQQTLLADLAAGIDGFWTQIDAAGASDRVLLMTTSEFGRRAAENAGGGTDHGAGGLSLLMGPTVRAGVHGRLGLDDLLDGDVRPVLDPRVLYTAALDWLGADVEAVLGRRFDSESLLT